MLLPTNKVFLQFLKHLSVFSLSWIRLKFNLVIWETNYYIGERLFKLKTAIQVKKIPLQTKNCTLGSCSQQPKREGFQGGFQWNAALYFLDSRAISSVYEFARQKALEIQLQNIIKGKLDCEAFKGEALKPYMEKPRKKCSLIIDIDIVTHWAEHEIVPDKN